MTNFIENGKIVFYPNIDLEATGKNIKALRENAGLSVKKLAELVGFEAVQEFIVGKKAKLFQL